MQHAARKLRVNSCAAASHCLLQCCCLNTREVELPQHMHLGLSAGCQASCLAWLAASIHSCSSQAAPTTTTSSGCLPTSPWLARAAVCSSTIPNAAGWASLACRPAACGIYVCLGKCMRHLCLSAECIPTTSHVAQHACAAPRLTSHNSMHSMPSVRCHVTLNPAHVSPA